MTFWRAVATAMFGFACALVLVLALVPERVTTVTQPVATKTRTVTVTAPGAAPAAPVAQRDKKGRWPTPPGTIQIASNLFLVRPGYEANMRHLCSHHSGTSDNGDFKAGGIYSIGYVSLDGYSWYKIQCNTYQRQWADPPQVSSAVFIPGPKP